MIPSSVTGAASRWRRLWNAPNSVLGLLGGLGGTAAWAADECVREVVGGWLIGVLSRRGWADAITLGDVILYADGAMRTVLHDHEMVHVHQGRAWGPLFLPAYGLESLWQWARTGNGYRHNRFEVAAYSVGR